MRAPRSPVPDVNLTRAVLAVRDLTLKASRTRADDLQPPPPAVCCAGRARVPSAWPSCAANPRPEVGSRNAASVRGAIGRRNSQRPGSGGTAAPATRFGRRREVALAAILRESSRTVHDAPFTRPLTERRTLRFEHCCGHHTHLDRRRTAGRGSALDPRSNVGKAAHRAAQGLLARAARPHAHLDAAGRRYPTGRRGASRSSQQPQHQDDWPTEGPSAKYPASAPGRARTGQPASARSAAAPSATASRRTSRSSVPVVRVGPVTALSPRPC